MENFALYNFRKLLKKYTILWKNNFERKYAEQDELKMNYMVLDTEHVSDIMRKSQLIWFLQYMQTLEYKANNGF